MVQRFLQVLRYETSGLHEAAFLLGTFAIFAKILALVRDRWLAYLFGASADLDIYYAAFRIPDFIFAGLASLVASAVLIPFIMERLNDAAEVRRFFSDIFSVFSVAIVAASAVIYVFLPALAPLIAPGFTESARHELVSLSRIMLFSPIFLGISGLIASVTQALNRFLVYALAPILYNVGIILGIAFLYPLFGLPGLAYGVVVGAVLHLAIQVPVLWSSNFVPRFTFRIHWTDVRRVLTLSVPRTITLAASHIVTLIFVAFASLVGEGSVTVFNLSLNLQSVPLSVIGVSYSVAAFPTLSLLFSNGKRAEFLGHISTAARHIIFWSLPITALFIVLRAQIVRTILGAGAFGWAETRLTAAALALFAVSVVAQSLVLLFVRGYYAAGYTKKPLIINLVSAAVTIAAGYFLLVAFSSSDMFRYFTEALLKVSGISGTALLMLPLAFTLGQLVNVALFWVVFTRDFPSSLRGLFRTLRESFYAAVIMGFAAYEALRVFDDVFDINTLFGIFAQGFLSGVIGIGAGVALLIILGNAEAREVWQTLHKRFWRRTPIAPDQGDLQQLR